MTFARNELPPVTGFWSLTLYEPAGGTRRQLAADTERANYSLTFRFYRPKGAVAERSYFPPPLVKQ